MGYPLEKLGNHIDILPGFAFQSKDFVNSGIPIIKIKNITPPSVSLIDLSYVHEKILQQQKKFQLKRGDVLIALTGSHINQMTSVVGRVARVRYDAVTLLNQRVGKIFVLDPENTNLDYVYYFLSQEEVKFKLAINAGGSANQANISPTDVKNIKIPFPSIKTQNKIAAILSAYDDLIENNQKQIKLLEEAARRLYKEWFVDLRFPGWESVPVTNGVPDGWKYGTLSEISIFKRGKTITKSQTQVGNIPVIAGGLSPAYYHNEANTVAPVITVSASGTAGFVRLYYVDVFASDCSFVDKDSTPYLFFVYCFLKENQVRLYSLKKGTAQFHVYAKDINSLELCIPDFEILECYSQIVEPYFKKIAILEQQNSIATEARDRLLPRLISGELEV